MPYMIWFCRVLGQFQLFDGLLLKFCCLLFVAYVAYFSFLMVLISVFVGYLNKRSWYTSIA